MEVGFSGHAGHVTKKLKVLNLLLYVEKDTVVMIQLSSMDTLPTSTLFYNVILFLYFKSHSLTMHHYIYKLDVEVHDGDETGIFIFWDNTLDELLGVTAAALLADQTKVITTAFVIFFQPHFYT
jgi:hypothetical protein